MSLSFAAPAAQAARLQKPRRAVAVRAAKPVRLQNLWALRSSGRRRTRAGRPCLVLRVTREAVAPDDRPAVTAEMHRRGTGATRAGDAAADRGGFGRVRVRVCESAEREPNSGLVAGRDVGGRLAPTSFGRISTAGPRARVERCCAHPGIAGVWQPDRRLHQGGREGVRWGHQPGLRCGLGHRGGALRRCLPQEGERQGESWAGRSPSRAVPGQCIRPRDAPRSAEGWKPRADVRERTAWPCEGHGYPHFAQRGVVESRCCAMGWVREVLQLLGVCFATEAFVPRCSPIPRLTRSPRTRSSSSARRTRLLTSAASTRIKLWAVQSVRVGSDGPRRVAAALDARAEVLFAPSELGLGASGGVCILRCD